MGLCYSGLSVASDSKTNSSLLGEKWGFTGHALEKSRSWF